MELPVEYPVEFLDSDSEPVERSAWRARFGRAEVPPAAIWVATGLWSAAAVLALLSTFQTVFTYRFDFSVIHTRGGYNALGYSLDATLAGDRWPGYAFILGFCSAVFALLAVVSIRAVFGGEQGRLHRYATSVGLAAVSLLIGVLICIGLALSAVFATYRGLARTLADGREGAVHLSIGACLWLGVAALACALAALVLTMLAKPTAPVTPEPDATG
jgi:hypothetical protein